MPEIIINEIDRTTGALSEDDYVVFVPGNIADDGKSEYIGENTLIESLSDFKEKIGTIIPEYSDGETIYDVPNKVNGKFKDFGYLTAYFLLSKGYKVYYKIPKSATPTSNVVISTNVVEKLSVVDISVTKENFENTSGVSVITPQEDYGVYTNVSLNTNTKYDKNTAYFTSSNSETTINYSSVSPENITTFWSNGSFVVDEVTYDKLYSNVTITKTTIGTTYKIINYGTLLNTLNSDTFYEELEDKSIYNLRFITTGGYFTVDDEVANSTLDTAIQTIRDIAGERGECVALVDHYYGYGVNDGEKILNSAKKVVSTGYEKYCAMYSPWCKYTIANTKDLIVPASLAYLEAFASATETYPSYYAMAGRVRGKISGVPTYNYGEIFANKLMSDDSVSVNPITNVTPYGIMIWGNRTLFANSEGLIASCFLNIRQLCCDIKKRLYRSAKAYMFEQNSDRLWFNFKNDITSLLDDMVTNQGIKGYKVIKLDTKEKAKIKALVRIIPVEAVEKFELTLELSDTLEITE